MSSNYDSGMPDQQQKSRPPEKAPWDQEASPFGGPRSPNVSKPDTNSIMKKLKKVESDQAKRYRQRSGE